ncbi:MAG: hypothetical protein AAF806_02465 [Bacteroidota bacterium]
MGKATKKEMRLLKDILDEHATADSRLIEEYFEHFVNYFQKIFYKQIDEDSIADVVLNSLFDFAKNKAQKYNPQQSSLIKYLENDIRGDIKNFLKKKSSKLSN